MRLSVPAGPATHCPGQGQGKGSDGPCGIQGRLPSLAGLIVGPGPGVMGGLPPTPVCIEQHCPLGVTCHSIAHSLEPRFVVFFLHN